MSAGSTCYTHDRRNAAVHEGLGEGRRGTCFDLLLGPSLCQPWRHKPAVCSLQNPHTFCFAGVDVLLLAVLDTKEVSSALAEAGVQKGQLENAIEDSRGSANVDSATADDQFDALKKYGVDLTEKAAELDPVIGRWVGWGRTGLRLSQVTWQSVDQSGDMLAPR